MMASDDITSLLRGGKPDDLRKIALRLLDADRSGARPIPFEQRMRLAELVSETMREGRTSPALIELLDRLIREYARLPEQETSADRRA